MSKHKLSPEQIVDNWNKLLKIIEDGFDGERRQKLLKLYNDFEERIVTCPASGKTFYHGAYPGGYVEHVINVISFAYIVHNNWIAAGAKPKYTEEELLFAALNHDLGKIGDIDNPYFIEHNERWRNDRGEIYIHNDKIRWMEVSDRSLWLLQNYGIKFTQTEMLAIMLHDGMYEESNKSYLVAFTEGKQLKDYLPIVIHHADMMATLVEKDDFMELNKKEKSENKPKINNKIKSDVALKIAKDFFKKDED
jgi:hypothetical protein